MNIKVMRYANEDIPAMVDIWNGVIEDGVAFPQEDFLDEVSATEFFAQQTYTAVAKDTDSNEVCGLYILHPNNVGRCGHICNTSYAVNSSHRSKGIGEMLVRDSLIKGRECGFSILQFNAVVASNTYARKLYKKLGFIQLGVIPKGFRMKDGHYEDICPYYIEL